jgi:prepilin-type N-terminal cleavage/methylation domain-containing protein
MKKLSINNQKGFTLIELLVVIGILAVLLAIVLIAINPARQFAQANDTKRRNDSLQILNAVWQYAADNNGNLPTDITTSVQEISNTAADICGDIVPTYINALPTDPSLNVDEVTDCAVAYDTNYTIVQSSSSSRVTVTAPDAELETITVSR